MSGGPFAAAQLTEVDRSTLTGPSSYGSPAKVQLDAPLVTPKVLGTSGRGHRYRGGLRVVVPIGVFGVWWLITGTGAVAATELPSPGATWHAFAQLWDNQDLIGDIGVSVARAAVGLAIGGSLGLVLGVVSGLFRLGEELIDSSMQMFRTIPFPAVIFLFIVWFGIGEDAKVALIALATIFPMYLNVAAGVRNVDRRIVEAARTFGLRGGRLVRQVILPLAMPQILTGLRFATGISVIALVFAETINANKGIGYLVSQASSFNQVPNLVVCIVLYALLGIGADLLVRGLERLALPWRRHVAVR